MTRRGAILITSASVGTGHISAGEALREALIARSSARIVEHVDILQFAPPWVRRIYGEGFVRIAERSRRFGQALYRSTNGQTPDNARWGHVAERVLFRHYRRIVRAGAWQSHICTHFLPCQVVAGSTRAPATDIVVTDWSLHRFWVQRSARQYFVATESIARLLRERVPSARVSVTGIPVAPSFAKGVDGSAVRRELGFADDDAVVLLMGGGWGLGVEDMVRNALCAGVPNLKLLVVCGTNTHAHQSLLDYAGDDVRLFGYVNGIDRLIAASDVVVTKPGGLTTAETFAMGKPLVLTRGLPGHEDRNAEELALVGAIQLGDSPGELTEVLERIFADEVFREQLKRVSRRAGRPQAAARIAALLDNFPRTYVSPAPLRIGVPYTNRLPAELRWSGGQR
jgi:processive 1,2-diacylglycerol beta-glucosyltransferase